MRANEGRANIIVWVGVGGGASFLQPVESWLYNCVPVRVPVLARLGDWESRDFDTLFFPVDATAASIISSLLVATANSSASVEVGIHQVILRSWETVLAVEWSTVCRDNSANLVGCPESKVTTARLLKEVSMSRVEADSTDFSRDSAFAVYLANISTSSNLVVVI